MSIYKSEIITNSANLCIGGAIALIDPLAASGLIAPSATRLIQLGSKYRSKSKNNRCEAAIQQAMDGFNVHGVNDDALKEAALILSTSNSKDTLNMETLVQLAKQGNVADEFAKTVFASLKVKDRIPEAVSIARTAVFAGIHAIFADPDLRGNLSVEIMLDAVKTIEDIRRLIEQLETKQDEVVKLLEAVLSKEKRSDIDATTIQMLQQQITELQNRLQNPEAALADAKATIAKLEDALAREGNAIGEARMAEAREALEAGDFSIADDIFADIEAREQLAVERAARAAFARGEIAEQEVRWHDAAKYYTRAASVNPTALNISKAQAFLQNAGDYAGSLYWGQQLIPAVIRDEGEGSVSHATCLNNLAALYEAQGKYDLAEPLFLQAIEIGKKTLGEDHPNYAKWLNNLALLYKTQGKYDLVEPLYLQAIEIGKKTLGEEHPNYATWLNNLALLYQAQGKFDLAEPLFLQAIAIGKKTLGEDHPEYAIRIGNLAGLYLSQERLFEAEPLRKQEYKIMTTVHGADHPHVATAANNLAELYRAQGKFDLAEPLYQSAFAILTKSLGPDHPSTQTVQANYDRLSKKR